MRWILTICCLAFVIQLVVTEEKKTEKHKDDEIKPITAEEKQFIKDVEARFGINQDKKDAIIEVEEPQEDGSAKADKTPPKPLPAVIAIELFNDTNSNPESKGKRTIDANLGYGYKTNTGYAYTYFGKPKEEKGRFMIYPYSQEDIPPPKTHRYHHSEKVTSVDIQPSKAFELVPVNQEPSYDTSTTVSEIKSERERVKGIEAPPPPQNFPNVPSTLFTTYESGQLSQLSGQFPNVMPDYLVDSNQLLHHPHYQSVGITPEHLHTHAPVLEQRIIPVLVLRIPTSHLQNPTAELYPNLPENYPLSHYLNQVNLQKLVMQYLHQLGYDTRAMPTQQYYAPPTPIAVPQMPQYVQQTYGQPMQPHMPDYAQYQLQSTVETPAIPIASEQDNGHQTTYAVHQTQEPEKSYRYLPPSAYVQGNSHHQVQPVYYETQSQEYEMAIQEQIPQGYEQYYQEQNAEPTVSAHQQQGYNYPSHYLEQNQYQSAVENSQEETDLPISENYPSKDHTRVTILTEEQKRQLKKIATQSVNYVTPPPGNKMFHKYKVMAPQPAIGLQQQHQPQYQYVYQNDYMPDRHYLPSYDSHTKSNTEYQQTHSTSYQRNQPKRFAGKMPAKGFKKSQKEKSK